MSGKDWFYLIFLVILAGVFTFFFVRMGIDPPEDEDREGDA